jgi:hypothetical protein
MAKSMEHPLAPIAQAIEQGNQQMTQALGQIMQTMNENQNRPKQVLRGADGRIVGVQ